MLCEDLLLDRVPSAFRLEPELRRRSSEALRVLNTLQFRLLLRIVFVERGPVVLQPTRCPLRATNRVTGSDIVDVVSAVSSNVWVGRVTLTEPGDL